MASAASFVPGEAMSLLPDAFQKGGLSLLMCPGDPQITPGDCPPPQMHCSPSWLHTAYTANL